MSKKISWEASPQYGDTVYRFIVTDGESGKIMDFFANKKGIDLQAFVDAITKAKRIMDEN